MKIKIILYTISLVIMALALVFAGYNHFAKFPFYLKIMPPYIPYKEAMVYISGVAEILLGVLLLVPKTRKIAAWGIIALLIAVFPANIYMYLNHQEFAPMMSEQALLIRLPIQFLLILWAYIYTRK